MHKLHVCQDRSHTYNHINSNNQSMFYYLMCITNFTSEFKVENERGLLGLPSQGLWLGVVRLGVTDVLIVLHSIFFVWAAVVHPHNKVVWKENKGEYKNVLSK